MRKAPNYTKPLATLVIVISSAVSSFAQNQQDSTNEARMQKQIELSKTNENHQLLARLNGKWSFKGRHIPADTTRMQIETFGTITRKGIWENQDRYFITETSSGKKIPMPWADWKEMTYHDMYIEGYDNVRKKFFFVSVGNHWNTGYVIGEGSYDSTAQTITYEFDLKPDPETIINVVRITKFINPDHYREESYSSVGGKVVQRSEANYIRDNSN